MSDIIRQVISDRLKQHRAELLLWRQDSLCPTVDEDDEMWAIMHDLRVAIDELEAVLRQAKPAVVLDT